MSSFLTVALFSFAAVPAVDLNQYPTDLAPQEFTVTESVTGNSYEQFNGVTTNPFVRN